MDHFKGKQFQKDVIIVAVGYYLRYNLSYREVQELGSLSENTFGGGTPKTKVLEYWSGTIPWIQSSDLENNKLFNVLPKKYITENAVKNSATKIVPSSSIVIVTRVGVGKLAFMTYEGSVAKFPKRV